MKKLLIYLFLFFILCFSIPIFFTAQFSSKEVAMSEKKNEIDPSTYDYKKYQTVRVLHTKTNQVEEMKLDDYLYGVVSAEMPASYEMEALKAQAVVARTYTLYKIQNGGGKHQAQNANICDSPTCCQAWISKEDRLAKWEESKREEYWNKIVSSVNSTQGKMITYEGKAINAFFHANSGGMTEPPINVWGGSNYPYLQAVATSGEDTYSQYSSQMTTSKEEFEKTIQKEHSNFQINWEEKDCIKIEEYTDGNRVKTIKIGNLNLSGVEVRTLFKLRSANFQITIEGDQVKFEVIGYGHGVGMSQTGADSLAKQGKSYEDIIKHFYTGVELTNI